MTWGRGVLSVFFVTWLATAVQPCAMAFSVDEPDCPHCPPTEAQPCEVMISHDCGLDDQITSEVRSNPLKLKDLPSDLPVATISAFVETARASPSSQPIPDDSVRLNPSGPPRHVLFCVYLK